MKVWELVAVLQEKPSQALVTFEDGVTVTEAIYRWRVAGPTMGEVVLRKQHQ